MQDAHSKNNSSAVSGGERSVAISGGATNVTINTGDTTIINAPSSDVNDLLRDILEAKIKPLSTDLSKEKAEKLETLLEKFREGKTEEAFDSIWELKKSSNWDAFESALKASILRTLAQLTLILKNEEGVDEAKNLAGEARKFNTSERDEILDARISIFEIGFEAAADKFLRIRTTESYNLWLNCLLNTGKFSEAAESRNNPPEDIKINAESHRFFALAFLALKDIATAKAEINKAFEEKPNWQYVRFTAAVIDYYSAVSPTALPDQLVAYPHPFPFVWAKIDDLSQSNLKSASEEFSKLAEEFNSDSRTARECHTWYFASVANQFGKRQEAIQIGLELLERDPTNLQILSWFLLRGYEFDIDKSRTVLSEKEEAGNASIADILGLIGISLKSQNWKQALEIIDRNKEFFSNIGEIDLWRYWRGTTLLHGEKPEDSKIEESEIKSPALKNLLTANILSFQGEKTSDWKPLLKFWEAKYKTTKDHESFASIYELKAQKTQDKKFVSEKADEYCAVVETAASVDFAVRTLWKLGESQQCLRLLEKYSSFFPNSELPDHLRRIKIHALLKSDFRKAHEEAVALSKEIPGPENIALLMDVQLVKGDLSGLTSTSKKLLQYSDTNTEQFLRAANLVKVEDHGLAVKLWTKAVEKGVPEDPDTALFAQDIAFKLGLENESSEIYRLLMREAQAKRGPMKFITIKQMLKLAEKNAKRQREVDEKYRTGEIPLQFVAEEKRMSLAEIFHWRADKNKEDGNIHQSARLFTRHGSRITYPTGSFTKLDNWNLHLDITSLLLAHKLDILEKLEELFKPIKISLHTITALIEQRDGLLPHQKSQLDNSRVIADLHRKKKIQITAEPTSSEVLEKFQQDVETFYQKQGKNFRGKKTNRLKKKRIVFTDPKKLKIQLGDRMVEITQAVAENGLAVGLLPLNCYGPSEYSILRIPEIYSNLIIDCRSILECLKANNRISDEKYKFAIKSLGQNSTPRASASPLLHTKLFLMSGVDNILAKAQILSAVCESFEVVISKSSLSSAEYTIQFYEELALLGDSIKELISRISDGLEEGVYEFIQIPDTRLNENSDEKIRQDMRAALDLFLFELKPGDIVCIDDRALTKFAIRQENGTVVPIISINELLQALRQNAKLDEQEYYSALLDLRRSNFRYLPIREDEIIYHLNLAQYQDNQIVETEALGILRRYHASCLFDEHSLRITGDQFSEAPFIYHGTEAIEDSIVRVWGEPKIDPGVANARTDWILKNLYTGNMGCTHLRKNKVIKANYHSDVQELASDICALIMRGIALVESPLADGQSHNLIQYFNWVESRILRTRYASSPEVVKAIGLEIAKRIELVFNLDYEDSERKKIAGYSLGKFFLKIPEKVSKQINLALPILEWMRVKTFDTITIENINFAATHYWQAIEDTINGKESSLKAIDTKTEYYLRQAQPDKKIENLNLFPVIKLFNTQDNVVAEMRDFLFGILLPNPADRLEVIYKQRELFDCAQAEFESKAKEIAELDDPIERIRHFYKIIENSTGFFYSQLEDRIRRRDDVFWSELMPCNAHNLAAYFRLPCYEENRDFADLWNEAAGSLNEESLEFEIKLVSSLPVRIPESVIDRFMQLSEEEKETLLKKLSSMEASPIQVLHLTNLAIRSINNETGKVHEIAQELVNRLYQGDNNIEFDAFRAILLFVTNEFYFWQENAKLSSQTALGLIWGHATRLYNVCRNVGMEPENIVEGFSRLRENYFYEPLVRKPELGRDCAYPYRISRTLFLTQAAANLFAGIALESLSSLNLPELMRSRLFRDRGDEPPMPAVRLLSDPFLFDDKLQSLFGGDRFKTLSPIIGADEIEVLKSENLEKSVETYLEAIIANPQDVKNWIMIYAIANDLPIYQRLQTLCMDAIRTISLENLYESEIENPEFLLFAIVNQIMNIDDPELRKDFNAKILEMLKRAIDKNESNENIDNILTLMNAALTLSYVPGNPTQSNNEFADVIDKISSEWAEFYDNFDHLFVNNFWNTLLAYSKKWRWLDLKFKSSY